MSEIDNIKVLKLTIDPQKKIIATHSLVGAISPLIHNIQVNSLQKDTINTLAKILREGRLLTEDEFRVLGANLYEALLKNPIGDLINSVISERLGFENQQDGILRLELEFKENESGGNDEVRELMSWPWEYLYCTHLNAGAFLSETTQLVLTRRLFLRPNEHERKLSIENGETPKVLFVSASPKAPGLGKVQGMQVYEVFSQEPIKSIVDLLNERPRRNDPSRKPLLITEDEEAEYPDNKPAATWQAFKNIVRTERPHIIHFLGHGRFENGEGQIAFMEDDYTYGPHWIGERDFANALMGITDLRLVFLQACESGMVDKIANTGPYRAISGVASTLAAYNIPAVVAMQYEIGNKVSNRFAKEFYTALLGSKAIEVALLQGREKILEDRKEWSISRAFGLPVLYLRNSTSSYSILPPLGANQNQFTNSSISPTTLPQPKPLSVTIAPGICPWCQTPYRNGVRRCKNCLLNFFCSTCDNSIIELVEEGYKFCDKCPTDPTPINLPTSVPRTSSASVSYSPTERTGPL